MIPFGRTVSVLIRNSFGNKVLWEKQKGWSLEGSRIRGSELAMESDQDDSGEGCGHEETRGQQGVCDLNMVCSGWGQEAHWRALAFERGIVDSVPL